MFGDFRFLVFFSVLLGVGANTLPLFSLQRHQPTTDEALKLAEGLFGPDDYNLTISDERFIVHSSDGYKRVEYDTISGGIWAADESELWNTTGGAPKDLPSNDEAVELAQELVARLKLLPAEAGPLTITAGRTSQTFLAHEFKNGSKGYSREEYPIDISVYFDLSIYLDGLKKQFPIVGGGGKFQVTYGRCKKLIAFQGLWREIMGGTPYKIMSKKEAEAQYLASLGHVAQQGQVTLNSSLAYLSEPFGSAQKKMYPVWVFEGQVVINGETIPIRPQATRGGDSTPLDYPTVTETRRSLQNLQTRSIEDDTYEAAAEWLGTPYGLSLSGQNVAGFRTGIRDSSPPWNYVYERSNEGVLQSDFVGNADTFVDSVDILFYNGHANQNGWMANAATGTGVEQWVNYSAFGELGNSTDGLLGHKDLEWLIIAACGPLQDEVVRAGTGNVFDRWRGIFSGLHIMFAYATASSDTAEEGSRFMKYAQEGYPLIDAWFRAAKDAQPPEVVVSVMWTDDARDDHLPGYGYVSDDNDASKERWAMWTTC